MKSTLTLLLLFQCATHLFAGTIKDSSLCDICTCDVTAATVECNKIKFQNPLNTTGFWKDKNTNESFSFLKVSIHNSEISRLTPFPKSPIKILDLSKNRIQNIDKETFKLFQNLSDLDLSDNDLISELFSPEIFRGLYTEGLYLPLRSMTALRLGNNGLHTLHQDTFEHMTNLQILDLKGNPLRVLDTQTTLAITNLAYLRELDLSYTYLSKLPDHIFHTSRNLTTLYLAGNLFTQIPKEHLEEARNLQYLNFNDNPITHITKEHGFPPMKHLKILHICDMSNLTHIEDESMSGLLGLKELHISNNHELTRIGKKALTTVIPGSETEVWPMVTKLYLKNNKLTHLEHEFLARWDILEEIDITENAWTCECENQWMIETLVKFIYEHRNRTHLKGLWCAAPVEMEGVSLYDVYHKNETLRCLDLYGGRPERDASILIGILIGLLIGIPLVLGILLCYRRNWFGYFNNSPAAFSRKFYNRADDEEFN